MSPERFERICACDLAEGDHIVVREFEGRVLTIGPTDAHHLYVRLDSEEGAELTTAATVLRKVSTGDDAATASADTPPAMESSESPASQGSGEPSDEEVERVVQVLATSELQHFPDSFPDPDLWRRMMATTILRAAHSGSEGCDGR